MLKFTLDTNCLIDVDEDRDGARFVEHLLDAARKGTANVAMVASSASERQKDNGFLDSMEIFKERMARLGFGHLELLQPLLRWDIGFWDAGLWADDEAEARETRIYKVMFPNSPKEWVDYAASANADPDDLSSGGFFRWRNQILDAQAFWAHDFNSRDVFVSSDRKFRRLEGAPDFPNAFVRDPREAADLL